MNKKKNTLNLEQKITNCKFDVLKKSLYFIIAPVIILLVGIILLCTTGFSKGIDFTGGFTFKVYVNESINEQVVIEGVDYYNLDVEKDYNIVYNKITKVLSNSNVNMVSYQTSDVNIDDQNIFNGQAVQVTFQSNDDSKDADYIREQIIATFDYQNADWAVSSIDEVPPVESFSWAIGITAGVVFAIIAAVIYMAFRYSKSALFVVFLQMALDLFLTLGLMLICRVTVNLTAGIVVFTAFMISLFNSFVFYNKVRENRKSGAYEGVNNNEMANKVTKQTAYKKILIYIASIIACIVFIIFGSSGVRMVALGMLLSLITTFYTSTFLLPAFWAIADKPKKIKQKI